MPACCDIDHALDHLESAASPMTRRSTGPLHPTRPRSPKSLEKADFRGMDQATLLSCLTHGLHRPGAAGNGAGLF